MHKKEEQYTRSDYFHTMKNTKYTNIPTTVLVN